MGSILGTVGQPQTKNIFLGDSPRPKCYYFVTTYHLSIRIFSDNYLVLGNRSTIHMFIASCHTLSIYTIIFVKFWVLACFLRVNAPGKYTVLHQG